MVKITGGREFVSRLRRLGSAEVREEVDKALWTGAAWVESDAKGSITTGSVSGKMHVPSLPGEPPNNDTGDLFRGIEAVKLAPLKAAVTSNAPHSIPLEFGTSKMAARPFMRPAAEKNRKAITEAVGKAMNRAIEKTRRKV